MSILVATGNVNLTNTVVGSCPYSPTCRYPGVVSWPIPLGNHHLKISFWNIVNSGTGNLVGLYSSPSGTAVDIACDGVTSADGEGNFPITDTDVYFYYHGPVAFAGFDYIVEATPAPTDTPVTYCAYGTRLKSGFPALVALSPTVILTIIGRFASSWKSVIASFFAGRLLDTADLCGQLPPPMPEITPGDILALTTYVAFGAHQEIVDKIWTWLQAASWPFFCECVPGTPDPVQPPDLPPPTSGDPPVYGPFPCDQSDQCAMLTQLLEQQDMMFGYFSMLRSEIQALQSQTAPWGYELGTLHSDLSGQGEFAVSGILGLSVEYTTLPSYIGQKTDDPTTYYSLGEIGLGTADGWKRSIKTSHNPHLIMPIGPEITRVSYSLATGAIANVQELVRHA